MTHLFFDIRKLQKLDEKRSPMFEKNRFAKVMVYIGIAFWAAYLVLFGVLLPSAFSEGFPGMEPYHILNKGLLIVLALDFLVRFLFPTPIQEVKPFLLLPVPKRKVMAALLLREAINPFNLFWLFFFVPFALLSVTRFYGLAGIVGYALGVWLLTVMNSYWSMLIRVLKRQKFIYICWCLPVYGLLALLEFLPGTHWVSTFTMNWGEGFILWNPFAFLGALTGIGLMGFINYKVQLRLIYNELSRVEDTKIKKISDYAFLDRYGNVGEYMRLELKMFFRNKSPRSQFWSLIAITVLFALALTFDVERLHLSRGRCRKTGKGQPDSLLSGFQTAAVQNSPSTAVHQACHGIADTGCAVDQERMSIPFTGLVHKNEMQRQASPRKMVQTVQSVFRNTVHHNNRSGNSRPVVKHAFQIRG